MSLFPRCAASVTGSLNLLFPPGPQATKKLLSGATIVGVSTSVQKAKSILTRTNITPECECLANQFFLNFDAQRGTVALAQVDSRVVVNELVTRLLCPGVSKPVRAPDLVREEVAGIFRDDAGSQPMNLALLKEIQWVAVEPKVRYQSY